MVDTNGDQSEDKVEGLAAGDGHVVGGGWTTGARRASRGRWTVGEEDGTTRDGGSGAGIMMMAASCKQVQKKDSTHWVWPRTPGCRSSSRQTQLMDMWTTTTTRMIAVMIIIIGILGWATVAGAFSGDDGRHLWTRQIGSEKSDTVAAVASTASGSAVFACGQTCGEVADGSFIGKGDVWVTKHDGKTGEELWVKQIGSERAEEPTSMASTGPGDAVYVAGSTFGAAIVDGSGSEDPAVAAGKPGGRDGFVANRWTAGRIMWSVVLGTNVDFL